MFIVTASIAYQSLDLDFRPFLLPVFLEVFLLLVESVLLLPLAVFLAVVFCSGAADSSGAGSAILAAPESGSHTGGDTSSDTGTSAGTLGSLTSAGAASCCAAPSINGSCSDTKAPTGS